MPERGGRAIDRGRAATAGLAVVYFVVFTATSWAKWAGFAYRTFDLAYYVQALWQLIHGRFDVSVQYVPLLGNHVEPIVFLFAPIFILWPHPMLFVAVQNAALAAMGPLAYRISRRLGLGELSAWLLAAAILITPATGYVALHEFHPEALSAPLLLWMFDARLARARLRYWIAFAAVLACKENMAPLLAAYCVVQMVRERKDASWSELRAWFIWPAAVAIAWFAVCGQLITPRLNGGNIDYLALYERLGGSGGAILRNLALQPQLFVRALHDSLGQGNLLPGLLLPFLCLPLLSPSWCIVAAPIVLQHLLSWRSSEWNIFFHYAAPLVPLCWMAMAEVVARFRQAADFRARIVLPASALVLAACAVAQAKLGPASVVARVNHEWRAGEADRARKQAVIDAIPAGASVVAPLPYLSHLATRSELHSLHYILKGLKTLSRAAFTPPAPTEFVLIDYGDKATFDTRSGYYHPKMRTVDVRTIASSDRLLHEFLRAATWESLATDELTLLRRTAAADVSAGIATQAVAEIVPGTELLAITQSRDTIAPNEVFELRMTWRFEHERGVIPWMLLQAVGADGQVKARWNRGLCAPQVSDGTALDGWRITRTGVLQPGEYQLEALFTDRAAAEASPSRGREQVSLLSLPVPVGTLRIVPLR